MIVLVTGGCGFIGSNFINHTYSTDSSVKIVNIDAMYYCAKEENIKENIRVDTNRYVFYSLNLSDEKEKIEHILKTHGVTHVVHFAAQSHVDNSFSTPLQYTKDNIYGTHNLLEACRVYGNIQKFIHISTDEVYGESMIDIREQKKTEESILCPTNPYAATKAGAELIVQSYYHSFKFPIIITRGNNVYGPNQYPEKLIPKFIKHLKEGNTVPIHGDGSSIRAFLHVDDVCSAIQIILNKGVIGEIYNIGSDCNGEIRVIDIARLLIRKVTGNLKNWKNYIEYVEDRPFNDKRYYISNEKLKNLGWNVTITLDQGINRLI